MTLNEAIGITGTYRGDLVLSLDDLRQWCEEHSSQYYILTSNRPLEYDQFACVGSHEVFSGYVLPTHFRYEGVWPKNRVDSIFAIPLAPPEDEDFGDMSSIL